MFDPVTLALIGGAVGGLLDKKKPLRGAALGAAGGYFAPGLLASPSVPAASAAPITEASVPASPETIAAAKSAGLSKHAPMANTMLSSAVMAKSLMPQDQPIQASPITPAQGGSQALSQLASQNPYGMASQKSMEDRMRRMEMLRRMGGGYGLIG